VISDAHQALAFWSAAVLRRFLTQLAFSNRRLIFQAEQAR